MDEKIRAGVYPTMITPYKDNDTLDMDAVDGLVEYYAACKCDGIFALCQSSEIFFLSEEEKIALMKRVYAANRGRMQLVASSHTADDLPTQIKQLGTMAEWGADACVMILNRIARQEESEDVCKRNIEAILNALPGVLFGIYESPYPYKRLASPELLKWCAQTDRIVFLKDTSCRVDDLRAKQAAVEGSNLTIYNANTATLLDSLRLGVCGYSGVMGNFHPDLYVHLLRLHHENNPLADELQAFLTMASWAEKQPYPVNAKYYRQMQGMDIQIHSRSNDASLWNPTLASELRQMLLLENLWRDRLGQP